MSRYDSLVIVVTMSMFAVLTVLGIWSVARRDKARVIWFSVFALMMGTFGSFRSDGWPDHVFSSWKSEPVPDHCPVLANQSWIRSAAVQSKGCRREGQVGHSGCRSAPGLCRRPFSTAVSAHAYQAVRDKFAPLLQKEYAVRDTAIDAEPCFILYDLDAKEFNFARSGLFAHYSTNVDKINAIVFYSKSTRLVGEWVTETGHSRVADAHSEFIKMTVVDVRTWSVVSSRSFEGIGTPDKEKGNYTNRISIADNQIQNYLNNLFSTTDR